MARCRKVVTYFVFVAVHLRTYFCHVICLKKFVLGQISTYGLYVPALTSTDFFSVNSQKVCGIDVIPLLA